MATTYTTTCTTHIELDLNAACQLGSNSIADRINDVVPGLKTSTAFFTFLRANLALQPSTMASNVSTPLLEPQHIFNHTAAPSAMTPSPLSRHVRSASSASTSSSHSSRPSTPAHPRSTTALADEFGDIPPLSLDVLTSRNDKVDALKLIADSIAQQRQRAALALIFHPLLFSGLILALAVTYRLTGGDLSLLTTVGAGVVMTYLAAIRYATAGYISLAEDLGYDWLVSPETGDEDVVIGTRFGNDIIGATVVRLEPAAHVVASPRRRKSGSLRGGKGVVRAWTTRLRYRGKGVGADMLHEAVRVTREKCGRDAEVGFAAGHANSGMVLPEMFNRTFRKGERKAAGALEKVLSEWESARRKR